MTLTETRRPRPGDEDYLPLLDDGLVVVERDGVLMVVCDCDNQWLCGHCVHDTCLDCGECAAAPCLCECGRAEQEEAEAEQSPELYLGTHEPSWLWRNDPRFNGITFFVSMHRFARRKTPMPRARHNVCIDSGGFTVLKKHGSWPTGAEEYLERIGRYRSELGEDRVRWIAPQDWMCEPWVIYGQNWHLPAGHRDYFHGTRAARGLAPDDPEQDLDTAVAIHQRYTVQNALDLRRLAPPGLKEKLICVVQGWSLPHYLNCIRLYQDAGIDLTKEDVVGLGSVCRRQATSEIKEIVETLAAHGLKLHGFGVKSKGLASYGRSLVSTDSLAWSDDARWAKEPLPGHEERHKKCNNCPDWALRWFNTRQQQLAEAA